MIFLQNYATSQNFHWADQKNCLVYNSQLYKIKIIVYNLRGELSISTVQSRFSDSFAGDQFFST